MTVLRPEIQALLPEAERTINRVARSFSLAARLLPRDVRRDVQLLYLVLRTLDDLVDAEVRIGESTRAAAERRLAAIDDWASGRGSGEPDGTAVDSSRELLILDDLARRHPTLPRDAIRDFLAGMRADLRGPAIVSDDDAARYCYQVAGTVGRLMASILGIAPGAEQAADRAARALGSAMQRTNILRDLAEDGRAGRVYLPDDVLRDAGIDPADAAKIVAYRDGHPKFATWKEVAAVPGIDCLLIGSSDLSMEMGIPGQNGHEKVRAAADTVIAACRKHGKRPGMGGAYSEELLSLYIGKGMKFILAGNDLPMLTGAARAHQAKVRAMK